MKPRQVTASLMLLSGALLACTFAGSASPSPDTAPATPGMASEATFPPLAPGTLLPTRVPPTPAFTITITASPTPTATTTLTPTIPPPPPVSTGPLDFAVGIIGCRLDAAREGGVILTIRFDATGGNGVYTYYRENQRTTRTFERPATKGTAVIDAFRVESGDGQRVDKKERFTGAQFGCP
jgi:hypothetical protein